MLQSVMRHPNRLRRQVAGTRQRRREARSKSREPGHCRTHGMRPAVWETPAKLSPTARLIWQVWAVWAVQRQMLARFQYFRFWWLAVFRGRSLDRIIQVLERLRRSKLHMEERVRQGLPRPKLQARAGRNYHHLVPKSRGGKARPQNLLLIRLDRHVGWHILFKDERNRDMTLDETIAMLIGWRQAFLGR